MLESSREAYNKNSVAASSICRQLGFVGIAIIWAFRVVGDQQQTVPTALTVPAILIVLSLALDLFQYVVATLIWGFYSRRIEVRKSQGHSIPEEVPRWFNWPAIFAFWVKVFLMIAAYVLLIVFLSGNVLWR